MVSAKCQLCGRGLMLDVGEALLEIAPSLLKMATCDTCMKEVEYRRKRRIAIPRVESKSGLDKEEDPF